MFKLKRDENLQDDEVIEALCSKYNVNADGWPKEKAKRRRRRLILFFKNNDPSLLKDVDRLCTRAEREDDSKTEGASDATFSDDGETLDERDLETITESGETIRELSRMKEEELFKVLFQAYGRDELGEKIKKKKQKKTQVDGGDLTSVKSGEADEEDEETEEEDVADTAAEANNEVSEDETAAGPAADEPEDEGLRRPFDIRPSAAWHRKKGTSTGRLLANAHSYQEMQEDLVENHGGYGANVSVDNPQRGFVPGKTQVWPPPQLDSVEALYHSELMKGLLQRYGGSVWSDSSYDNPNDGFSRLLRKYDQTSIHPSQEKQFFDPPPVPQPPLQLRRYGKSGDINASDHSAHQRSLRVDPTLSTGPLRGNDTNGVLPRAKTTSYASNVRSSNRIHALNNATDEIVRLAKSRQAMDPDFAASQQVFASPSGSFQRQGNDSTSSPASGRGSPWKGKAPVGKYIVAGAKQHDVQYTVEALRADHEDLYQAQALQAEHMKTVDRKADLYEQASQIAAEAVQRSYRPYTAMLDTNAHSKKERVLWVEDESPERHLRNLKDFGMTEPKSASKAQRPLDPSPLVGLRPLSGRSPASFGSPSTQHRGGTESPTPIGRRVRFDHI